MNKLIRPVEREYVPGEPGTPPTPDRCYTVEVNNNSTNNTFLSSSNSEPSLSDRYAVFENSGGTIGFQYVPTYTTTYETSTSETGVASVIVSNYSSFDSSLAGLTYYPMRNQDTTPTYYNSTEQIICEPGDPGSPGTPGYYISIDGGPDWNGAARSIKSVSGNAYAEFRLNVANAIAIGFGNEDNGATLSDIRVGIAVTRSGGSNVVKTITNGVFSAGSIGLYTQGDVIRIQRMDGMFYVTSPTFSYEMPMPSSLSNDTSVFLDAMLYVSGDYVEDPSISSVSGPTYSASQEPEYDWLANTINDSVGFIGTFSSEGVSVSGNIGFTGDVTTAVDGVVEAYPKTTLGFTAAVVSQYQITLSAYTQLGFTGSLAGIEDINQGGVVIPAIKVFGADAAYGDASIELPSLSMTAYISNVVLEAAGAELSIPPMVMAASGATGAIGGSTLELPSLIGVAADSAGYAQGYGSLPAMFMYADDGFGIPNYYGWNEPVRLSAYFATDPIVIVSFSDNLDIADSMSVSLIFDQVWVDGLGLHDTMSLSMMLEAFFSSGLNLASANKIPTEETIAYAFNTLTGAASRYSGFDFNQYVKVGGATYAVKSDGLYKLRGGDDDGVQRSALVRLGASMLGVPTRTRMGNVFLGLHSDGSVYVKVITDDNDEYLYRATQREPCMRVDVGRGLTAREWEMELHIVDASEVELSEIEFVFAATATRRSK